MGSDGVFDNLWPLFLAMDVLDGRDFLNIDYIYILYVYIYIYICIYAPQKKRHARNAMRPSVGEYHTRMLWDEWIRNSFMNENDDKVSC